MNCHDHYQETISRQAQEIERLSAIVARALNNGYQQRQEIAQLKSRQSGVVLPEPMKRGDEGGSGEYGAAMIRGFNACLREVARLNSSAVSAGPTESDLQSSGLGYPLAKEQAVQLWRQGFRSEPISVLEAWEAIGHDIGCNPSKEELMDSLRNMSAICRAHGCDMPARAALSAPSHSEQVRHMAPDEMRSLAQRLREYNLNPHHINPMSEEFHVLVVDAANALSAACVPKEISVAITWAEHLLFECGALTNTRAPSAHVYNKAFEAVNTAKAMIAAAPSPGKQQGVMHEA